MSNTPFSALVTKMEQTKNKMEEADAEQNLRKKRRKKFLLVALLALLVIFIIIGKCWCFYKLPSVSKSIPIDVFTTICRRIIWWWRWEELQSWSLAAWSWRMPLWSLPLWGSTHVCSAKQIVSGLYMLFVCFYDLISSRCNGVADCPLSETSQVFLILW